MGDQFLDFNPSQKDIYKLPIIVHTFNGPDNHFFPKYTISGIPSAQDTDPYCSAGHDNWEEIGSLLLKTGNNHEELFVKVPEVLICLADGITPPYYKEQYKASVLIKNIGLETGIVLSPENQFYMTSGVYKKNNDLFVLLARPLTLVTEVEEVLKSEFKKGGKLEEQTLQKDKIKGQEF